MPPFKASKYLVTNREFLEFVKDGGYENSKYWTKEGETGSLASVTVSFCWYGWNISFTCRRFVSWTQSVFSVVCFNLFVHLLAALAVKVLFVCCVRFFAFFLFCDVFVGTLLTSWVMGGSSWNAINVDLMGQKWLWSWWHTFQASYWRTTTTLRKLISKYYRLSSDVFTWRFDCILLVFFRRWGRLAKRHLINRGGPRGGVQGVHATPSPWDNLRLSKISSILQGEKNLRRS